MTKSEKIAAIADLFEEVTGERDVAAAERLIEIVATIGVEGIAAAVGRILDTEA